MLQIQLDLMDLQLVEQFEYVTRPLRLGSHAMKQGQSFCSGRRDLGSWRRTSLKQGFSLTAQ